MTGLVYVDGTEPGFTRRKKGRIYHYFAPSGERVTAEDVIARLNSLAMPPAYRRCWFCTLPNGHLQATGYDKRRRKQYRYHPDFRARREADKFDRCAAFGEALPEMRRRVENDLRKRSLSRERTLAAIVRMLDLGLMRVGNACYARENGSYGAVTLLRNHVERDGGALRVQYKAKSGKEREIELTDPALARFVRQIQDLPGQRLFIFRDEEGQAHEVGSSQVNAYIQETMGQEFSAKHFRTFGGSVVALETLCEARAAITIKDMIAPVADALGNTPAVSRRSYVHPRLVDICSGDQQQWREQFHLPRSSKWMSRAERGLVKLLESQ